MADRKNLRKVLLAAGIFLTGCFFSSSAGAITVSGTVNDVSGSPAPHIKVCVMDYNPAWFDTERDCVQTNAAGAYTSSKVLTDDDVYLLVYYEAPADPGTPSLAPGQRVKVVNNNSSSVITFSTSGHTGGYIPDIKANSVINIPSAAGQPALGDEVKGIQGIHDVFNYIRAQGVSNYKCNYTIWININTSDPDEWPNAQGEKQTLHMGINRLSEARVWYTFYHEFGHIIHYNSYSPPRWPPGRTGGTHSRATHSDTGFAMVEGWAEAIGDLVSSANGHPPGTTFATAWRGEDPVGDPPETLGTPSGSDNSGEVVEGSYCEIIKGSNFRFMMESLVGTNPDNYKQLAAGFLGRSGSGPVFINLIAVQRKWGIVYSRAKFTGFHESAPDFSGGEDDGNAAKIDGLMFLRGLIHPKYEENTKEELNLQSDTIGIDEIKMGYKTASNGLDTHLFGSDSSFTSWTAPVAFGSRIDFRTDEKFDQDMDLILEVKDVHGSWDDFYPTFFMDPIPPGGKDYSSDERWLKRLNTWYNQDAFADNDDEGKVIIDNNDPIVDPKALKPAGQSRSWQSGGNGIYVRIYPSSARS